MQASIAGYLDVVQKLFQALGDEGLEERDADGRTALYHTAEEGHEQVVMLLLSRGVQPHSARHSGRTPLMAACSRGHMDVAHLLWQHVGEQGLEERSKKGRTPLLYAATGGHERVVAFLLSHGARANSQDGKGKTPIMTAARKGHLGVVEKLLQVVGDQGLAERDVKGWSALHHAAHKGHDQVVAFLLSMRAQANSQDGNGVTPLMTSSWRGHLRVVQKLLHVVGDQGLADMDEDGWTVLHHAADGGHEEVVKLLLGNGAQANSKDGKDMTPLMHASSEGHLGVVQTLVEVVGPGEQGLEERSNGGWTALHFAADKGHEEIIKFLVSNGAQANSKDGRDKTPLMLTSRKGHLGVAQQLHQVVGNQGLADRDVGGWMALHYAVDKGHEEVVEFLLSKGAQANSKDGQGQTPLIMASRRGHMGGVQKLLQAVGDQGLADIDEQGRTALHLAAERGHEEVVAFLLSKGAEVHSYDSEGNTPLLLACMDHHLGVVRAFLQHTHVQGLNERNADGRTALHVACIVGYAEDAEVAKDIVRALLLAGADPTVVDDEGDTPRTLAEAEWYTEVVSVFEWWEAELERPYLLHRAKCLSDVYMRQQVAPPALPRVEVVAVQQEHEGTVGRKASAEARGTQEGEEERHAMVTYAMNKMNEQLYIELLEGFHG